MEFVYSEELIDYMTKKGKKNIIVEIAKSDSSDFNVEEFHIHLVSDKQADLFIKRQGFHPYETPVGRILLPNYKLEYSDTVSFGVKKILLWQIVTATGISF